MKYRLKLSYYKIVLLVLFLNFVFFVFKLLTNSIGLTHVQVAEQLIDFGEIQKTDTTLAVFKIKNIGQEDLVISEVKASCGCTVPFWSEEPVGPGEWTEIKAIYDKSDIGIFQKYISVLCNAKDSPIELTIQGKVLIENN